MPQFEVTAFTECMPIKQAKQCPMTSGFGHHDLNAGLQHKSKFETIYTFFYNFVAGLKFKFLYMQSYEVIFFWQIRFSITNLLKIYKIARVTIILLRAWPALKHVGFEFPISQSEQTAIFWFASKTRNMMHLVPAHTCATGGGRWNQYWHEINTCNIYHCVAKVRMLGFEPITFEKVHERCTPCGWPFASFAFAENQYQYWLTFEKGMKLYQI